MLWLAAVSAGLCAACLAHALLAPLWFATRVSGSDSGMPWWWRATRPWTAALARLIGPWLSWRARARWKRRMTQAGLPSRVGEPDVAALAWLGAGMGAALAAACAVALDVAPAAPAVLAALAGACWPGLWLRRLAAQRWRRIDRDMPFVLDLMTLCVEAGLGLHGALLQATRSSPAGPLRQALDEALADMRAGVPRAAALKDMAGRSGSAALAAWVSTMAQADLMGMSLGPLMRAQAAQCRADRFQRAERLAMEAPVKMLLPLIGCIFPCTFIVLGFPIVWQMLPALR
jgi:tight adherence protein C